MRKNKDEKQTTKKIKERFNEILELPKEVLLDLSRIIILGNEQILVENYKGMTEYEENIIRLNNNINIFGSKLKVEEITSDEIMIVGKISSIEFDDD